MFKEKKGLIQIKDANSFSNIEIKRLKYLMDKITFIVQNALDLRFVKIEDLTSDWVENYMQLIEKQEIFEGIIKTSNVDYLFEISYKEELEFDDLLRECRDSKWLKLIC